MAEIVRNQYIHQKYGKEQAGLTILKCSYEFVAT